MKNLYFLAFLLFAGCEEKRKPQIVISPNLSRPIQCMKLNTLNVEKDVLGKLKALYAFDSSCDVTLSVSYKKDIVCSSTQNIQMKNMGKFPMSYFRMELRSGMSILYSYYIDLYNNVDGDDISEAFERLKSDLIEMRAVEKKQ